MPSITSTLKSTLTLYGMCMSKMRISIGMVTKTAIAVDETMLKVTTSGIGFINSPMIPVDKRSGTKAHIVVMVVDQSGTIKSRQTRRPTC